MFVDVGLGAMGHQGVGLLVHLAHVLLVTIRQAGMLTYAGVASGKVTRDIG